MEHIIERAKHIKILACDLDGVLTDGALFYTENFTEAKRFHVQDGLGLKILMALGFHVAIITAGKNPLVEKRMKDLGIQHVYIGQSYKLSAYQHLLTTLNCEEKHIAYVGDDLPDLPLIQRAGLGITVANGHPALIEHAHWQTKKSGGDGAVREICDLLLEAQSLTTQAIDLFHRGDDAVSF